MAAPLLPQYTGIAGLSPCRYDDRDKIAEVTSPPGGVQHRQPFMGIVMKSTISNRVEDPL